MAQMVPETIPSKASQGEKLLFNLLRDRLPDDCRVWYEPRVKGLYPDFIILGPTFGLLVLEVKGWYTYQITAQNPQYQEHIEVRHLHDWARSLLGRLPNSQEFTNDEEYDQFLGDRVLATLQQRSPEQTWDSVLVDEAHTFNPNWFLCCIATLKDPQEGDLLVVSHGSQSLYRRRKFSV